MKAASFASIAALALAGTACSEKAPAETETPAPAAETAEVETPQFNLRYPGSDNTSASANSEFNLRVPDASADASGDIRLPEGAVRDNALDSVEEIRTPALPDERQSEDPDEDIIRLD